MLLKPQDFALYAVTDRAWTGERTLAEQVEAAIEGGVTFVQLREKKLDDAAFIAEAREIKAVCAAHGVPFVINDRVDIAAEVGADGVHVGQSDMAAGNARRILGDDAIVGVTCKTVEQAKRAEAAGATCIGSGAVFGSTTKLDASVMSLDTLRSIAAAVSIPVNAIGGITAENVCQLAGTGIAGIAVVGAIFAQPDCKAAARELRSKVDAILQA